MVRDVAIVGAGQAGIVLAAELLRMGFRVSLYSDKTSEEYVAGNVRPTACLFGDSVVRERELGLDFWAGQAPSIERIHLDLGPKIRCIAFSMSAPLRRPALAVDQRLKFSRGVTEMQRRGARLELAPLSVEALEGIAADHDLTVVTVGHRSLGSALFERPSLRPGAPANVRRTGRDVSVAARPDALMPATCDVPPILSLLTSVESRQMARDRRWPKWSTQCLMHSLGLAVLDACLVTPDAAPQLAEAVEAFMRLHDSTAVMVRSDGGIETTTYQRGGHTLPVEHAVERAHELLSHGRAVLLLEPTNRFTNRLTAMIRIDRDAPHGGTGQLTAEVLGPGYDLADLARSGVQPQARIEVHNIDWDRPESLWPHDVVVTVVDASGATRLEARLDFIGAHCLPGPAVVDKVTRVERAKAWLSEREYGELFEPFALTSALRHLPDWHRDGFSIAADIPHAGWTCVATGWSDLGTGRTVYWDIIDGRNKYGRHG